MAKRQVPVYVRAVRHVLTEATRRWRMADDDWPQEAVSRPWYTVRIQSGQCYRLKWYAVPHLVVEKVAAVVTQLASVGLPLDDCPADGPAGRGLNVYAETDCPKWLQDPTLRQLALAGDEGPLSDWLLDHGIMCSPTAAKLVVQLVNYMATEEGE